MALLYDLTSDFEFVPKGKKKEDEFRYLTDLWESTLPPLPSENIGSPVGYGPSESPLPWEEEIANDPYAGMLPDENMWGAALPDQPSGFEQPTGLPEWGFDTPLPSQGIGIGDEPQWQLPEQRDLGSGLLPSQGIGLEGEVPWSLPGPQQEQWSGRFQDALGFGGPDKSGIEWRDTQQQQADEGFQRFASTGWDSPRVGHYALDDPQTYGELLGNQARPLYDQWQQKSEEDEQALVASGKYETIDVPRVWSDPTFGVRTVVKRDENGQPVERGGDSFWGKVTPNWLETEIREGREGDRLDGNALFGSGLMPEEDSFLGTAMNAGAKNFEGITGHETTDVPGGALGEAIAASLFDPLTIAPFGVVAKAGMGLKTAKAAGMLGTALGAERSPVARLGTELAINAGARAVSTEADQRLPQDMNPYLRAPLVLGSGFVGGGGAMAGAGAVGPAGRAVGRGVKAADAAARGLDARWNEPAGFEAGGRTTAGMDVPEKPANPIAPLEAAGPPGSIASLESLTPEAQGPLLAAADELGMTPEQVGAAVRSDPEGFRAIADEAVGRPVTPEAATAALPERPSTNYLVELSDYTPILYREASLEDARYYLPNTWNSSRGGGLGLEPFYSNTADLALGQGGNKGILFEFDSAGIRGTINKSKPGWEFSWDEGMAEFKGRADPPRANLRAITYDPKVRPKTAFERGALRYGIEELEGLGWARTDLPDGRIRLERPVTPEPTAGVAREAPVARVPLSDLPAGSLAKMSLEDVIASAEINNPIETYIPLKSLSPAVRKRALKELLSPGGAGDDLPHGAVLAEGSTLSKGTTYLTGKTDRYGNPERVSAILVSGKESPYYKPFESAPVREPRISGAKVVEEAATPVDRIAALDEKVARGEATPAEEAVVSSVKKRAKATTKAEMAEADKEVVDDLARVIMDEASSGEPPKPPPRETGKAPQEPEGGKPTPPEDDARRYLREQREQRDAGVVEALKKRNQGRQFGEVNARFKEGYENGLRGEELDAYAMKGAEGGLGETGITPLSDEGIVYVREQVQEAYRAGKINDAQYLEALDGIRQSVGNGWIEPKQLTLLESIVGKNIAESMAARDLSGGVVDMELPVVNPSGVRVTGEPTYTELRDSWRSAAKAANEAELAARAPGADELAKTRAERARRGANEAKAAFDRATPESRATHRAAQNAAAAEPTPESIEKAARSLGFKIARTGYSVTVETLLGSKAIKASLDLSAMLRQGALVGGAHPKIAAKAFGKQFEGWKSKQGYDDLMEDLANSPNASWHEGGGLAVTDTLTKSEEQFTGHFVEKMNLHNLPGRAGKVGAKISNARLGPVPIGKALDLGDAVAASSRAYSALLNYMRVHVFDTVWDSLPDSAKTTERAKALSGLINASTGRGSLPSRLGSNNKILNTIFFAPRYVVSRPEFIYRAGKLAVTDKYLRGEALKQLTGYFAATGTLMALGVAAYEASDGKVGWQVDLNPKSGNFGNMKIGPVSYDPWGGFSQIAKLAIQASTAEKYSGNSGTNRDLSRFLKYGPAKEPAKRFARGKLSPAASLYTSLQSGRDFDGNKISTDPIGLLSDLAEPLSFSEMRKAWMEYDLKTALMTVPGLLGVGVNVQPKDNYEIASKAAYDEFNPEKDTGVPYEKPKRAYWDPLFKRLFNEKNPDIEPAVRGERAEKSVALIKEYETKQAENTKLFKDGDKTVGKWKDWRTTLGYSKQQEREQVLGEFVGADPPKDTPAYWVKSYSDTFARLPDDSPDYDTTRANQEKWMNEHGGTALAYVNSFFSADKSPEDRAYIKAMQKIGGDGYFDREKMPHYDGLKSGTDELELEKLETMVGAKRNPIDAPALAKSFEKMDWAKSAMIILENEGVPPAQIEDVIKVHAAKLAATALADGRKADSYGFSHLNGNYFMYKQSHPKELAWLNDSYTYDQMLEIYGGSFETD